MQVQQQVSRLCMLFFVLSSMTLFANSHPESSNHKTVVKNQSTSYFLPTDKPISDFGIVEAPLNGKVTFEKNNTLVYTPSKNVCEEVDVFKYFYEDAEGRDTVSIFVEILCEELTILNGFTPEAEDDPTTFTIVGVENFPNNTLYIFDDEGNQVFFEEGYDNDWDGSNVGASASLSYTYYYIFNDGVGKTYSGYIQID